MRKLRLLALASALSAFMVLGTAPSAGATTCVIADPDVEAVVCLVYGTAGGLICQKPVDKLGGCPR